MDVSWEKLGALLLREGRADEALGLFARAALERRAPVRPPGDGDAAEAEDRGRALLRDGRLDEAAAFYGLERREARPIRIEPGEVLCCSGVRNEAARLPFFLAYYRRLGVRHFFFVDNASTDGTEELLLAEPDVRLWRTACSFRVGRCGSAWFQVLLERHALDRWCAIVDADEVLLYPDCEERPLPALCAELDARGKRALTAILVDMYSDRPVAETRCRPGQDPIEACPYFDREFVHYRHTLAGPRKNQTLCCGGMRRRVFGDDGRQFWLQKAPLVKYGRGTVLDPGQHWTSAPREEIAEETGCLLHFKYVSTFPLRAADEVRRGEHAGHSREYERYARGLEREAALVLHDPARSVRLEGGSRQLLELGVMRRRPRAPAAEGGPARRRCASASKPHVLLYSDCPRTYGAEQVNHAVLRRLAAEGYPLTCVQSFAENALVAERRALGIPHRWLEFDTIEDASDLFLRASSNFEEAGRIFDDVRPDLVIFAGGCPFSSLAAKREAARMGIPFVIVEHLGWPPGWPPGARAPVGEVAAAYSEARAVVAVCREELDFLRARFGLPPDRSEAIESGRPAGFFRPRHAAVRERVRRALGIPDDAVVSLTTARLEAVKGYQYQLAAIRALRDADVWPRLHFVWAGEGSARGALALALERLGAARRVRILGPRDDVQDLLDAADLFVLPSRVEALSLSVIEAMAKGLPVAATAVNGTPEALGDTGRLLPDPKSDARGTVRGLEDAIVAWAADAALRDAAGAACRRRALERFTEERMVERYARLVARALGDGR